MTWKVLCPDDQDWEDDISSLTTARMEQSAAGTECPCGGAHRVINEETGEEYKPPSTKKRRGQTRCTACRTLGHNRRSPECPEGPALSRRSDARSTSLIG